MVWIFSVFSLLALALLVLYFCKNFFDKSFLLSQLIILAPLSEDYFVRKDSFLVLCYGLCLLIMKELYQKSLNKMITFLCVNFISIIAIFSHESYGIWGLPSLFIIYFIFEKYAKNNDTKNMLHYYLSTTKKEKKKKEIFVSQYPVNWPAIKTQSSFSWIDHTISVLWKKDSYTMSLCVL